VAGAIVKIVIKSAVRAGRARVDGLPNVLWEPRIAVNVRGGPAESDAIGWEENRSVPGYWAG